MMQCDSGRGLDPLWCFALCPDKFGLTLVQRSLCCSHQNPQSVLSVLETLACPHSVLSLSTCVLSLALSDLLIVRLSWLTRELRGLGLKELPWVLWRKLSDLYGWLDAPSIQVYQGSSDDPSLCLLLFILRP